MPWTNRLAFGASTAAVGGGTLAVGVVHAASNAAAASIVDRSKVGSREFS
jgi:hypothetical protein